MFVCVLRCIESVCVNHLNRCKTSTCLVAGGRWGTLQSAANEDAAMFLCKRTCFIYIYTYIVPPLGAYKTQPGKDMYFIAVVLYGQCLL